MTSKIINFVLFQLIWFVCILGAAMNETHAALALSILLISLHFYLNKNKKNELKILLIASIIGFLFDGILLKAGLVTYTSPGWSYSLTPLWIVVLWMSFSITLNSSLNWLKKRLNLSILFGAIGGPVAYIAGEKLGAVTLMTPDTIIVISIGWSIITPLLIHISKKISLNA